MSYVEPTAVVVNEIVDPLFTRIIVEKLPTLELPKLVHVTVPDASVWLVLEVSVYASVTTTVVAVAESHAIGVEKRYVPFAGAVYIVTEPRLPDWLA